MNVHLCRWGGRIGRWNRFTAIEQKVPLSEFFPLDELIPRHEIRRVEPSFLIVAIAEVRSQSDRAKCPHSSWECHDLWRLEANSNAIGKTRVRSSRALNEVNAAKIVQYFLRLVGGRTDHRNCDRRHRGGSYSETDASCEALNDPLTTAQA